MAFENERELLLQITEHFIERFDGQVRRWEFDEFVGLGIRERVASPTPVRRPLIEARRYVLRVAREPAIGRVEIDPRGDFPELDPAHLVWTAAP